MSLPQHLTEAYYNWQASDFQDQKAKFEKLISDGQHPQAMIISCCDSRVQTTNIFGVSEGDFFIHRNIANFVPPHHSQADSHGTGAAIEYAVTALGVKHIIVVGHAMCGGVQGCYDLHSGANPALADPSSYVGQWVSLMRPSFDAIAGTDQETDGRARERANVVVSLAHLAEFPFVKAAMETGHLQIHGLWHDIAEGTMWEFQEDGGIFTKL